MFITDCSCVRFNLKDVTNRSAFKLLREKKTKCLISLTGLHDNPWLCDCRLHDLVQFQKSPSSLVALIDTRLKCADPESLSGVLFTEAELQRCQGPRVHTAVARVRSSLGNNVLLRCGTVGVPIPELSWSRADGKKLNGTSKF